MKQGLNHHGTPTRPSISAKNRRLCRGCVMTPSSKLSPASFTVEIFPPNRPNGRFCGNISTVNAPQQPPVPASRTRPVPHSKTQQQPRGKLTCPLARPQLPAANQAAASQVNPLARWLDPGSPPSEHPATSAPPRVQPTTVSPPTVTTLVHCRDIPGFWPFLGQKPRISRQ